MLKSRDTPLLTKIQIAKAVVFPAVIYRCESWTLKKAEHRRIDAFKLWCRRRLLRVPWTAKRLNQSILKEINPDYSLEGLVLKLKLQYFGHLMRRADSSKKKKNPEKCWERLKAGVERDRQRMRCLDGTTNSIDLSLGKPHEVDKDRESWGAAVYGVEKSQK